MINLIYRLLLCAPIFNIHGLLHPRVSYVLLRNSLRGVYFRDIRGEIIRRLADF